MRFLPLLLLLLTVGSAFAVTDAQLTGSQSVQYPTGSAGASTTVYYTCGGWASSETSVQARIYKDGSLYSSGVVKSGTQSGYVSSRFGLTFGSGGITSSTKLLCDWTSTQTTNGADSPELAVAVGAATSSAIQSPPVNSGGSSPPAVTAPPSTGTTPPTSATATAICAAGRVACASDQKTLVLCASDGKSWSFWRYCYDGCVSTVTNDGLCIVKNTTALANQTFTTNSSAVAGIKLSTSMSSIIPVLLLLTVLGGGLLARRGS